MSIEYKDSYCEEKGISISQLTEAQRTLHFIAENMKLEKKISADGYRYFQEAIKALGEDCISREDTLKAMIKELCIKNEDYLLPAEATLYKVVKNMPPVTLAELEREEEKEDFER